MNISRCSNCGAEDHYASKPTSSGGGYAPNYLPGLGGTFKSARFRLVVCGACGLTRFFAEPEALEKIPTSRKWERF